MADVTFTFEVKGVDAVNRGLDKTEKNLEEIQKDGRKAGKELGKGFENAGKSASKFGGVLKGLAGAIAVGSIVSGIKSIIEVTSDAEQTAGKFDAVFKDLAPTIRDWAATTSDALGRSRFELEKYLATLQDTFVPLGFARDQAANLSTTLTELALDLAAFNNEAEPDVVNSLTSAIVGNTEAVRKYGIIITQSRLDTELLNMGIEGGVKAATEQQKALARLNIILESTTDAQGAAARETDSFESKSRALSAAVQELMISLGRGGLLDAATLVVSKLIELVEWGGRAADGLAELGLTADRIKVPFAFLGNLWETLTTALGTLGAAMAAIISGEFRLLDDILAEAKDSFREVWRAAEEGNATFDKLRGTVDKTAESTENLAEKFQTNMQRMVADSKKAATTIQEDQKAINESWEEAGEEIREESEFTAEWMEETQCKAQEKITECVKESADKQKVIARSTNQLWQRTSNSMRESFRGFFRSTIVQGEGLRSALSSTFENVANRIKGLLADLVADKIFDLLSKTIIGAGTFASNVKTGIGNVAQAGGIPVSLQSLGGPCVPTCNVGRGAPGAPQEVGGEGGLGGLGAALGGARLGFTLGGPIGAAVGGVGGFLLSQFDIGKVVSNVGNFFGDVASGIGDVIGDIGSAIGDFFGDLFQRGGDFIASQPQGIIVGDVPERVTVTPLGRGQRAAGVNIILQGTTVMDEIGLRRFTQRIDRELNTRNLRRV